MFLDYIDNESKWQEFLNYKLSSDFVSKNEKLILKDFIENKKYIRFTKGIKNGKYDFSIPKKHIISKSHTSKKRIVYSFNDEEMLILKYVAFLLYEYDYLFENNLYSFRRNICVKNAIKNISNIKNLNKMYGYKVDIKNYFNSIDTNLLLNDLEKELDYNLFNFIKNIIDSDKVNYNNKIINEKKGVMAGIPIASFLANCYIRKIDTYFKKQKVLYLRYSDDIIIFCNNKDEIQKYAFMLKQMLNDYKLVINSEKEFFYNPHDKWEFLGFSFCYQKIDLSNNTLYKIKGKIRRSAKSIRRWMIKNNVDYEKTLKVMINKYNKKFFGNKNTELSWKYWFFGAINTSKSLKIVDNYLQDNLRYLVTGKHNKKNYKIVPYDLLKRLGYKALVHEYYSFINLKNNV